MFFSRPDVIYLNFCVIHGLYSVSGESVRLRNMECALQVEAVDLLALYSPSPLS